MPGAYRAEADERTRSGRAAGSRPLSLADDDRRTE
jgi:hypothetical protein